MKRPALLLGLLLAAACAFSGCEREGPVSRYNPQYDGLLPVAHGPVDTTILDNQANLYAKMGGTPAANRGAAPAPAAPAAPAAPGSPTPPPPPG